jgi:hypothetical protein
MWPAVQTMEKRLVDWLNTMVEAAVFDAGETLVNESRQWRMWADG